ncbi:DUF6942 family protein [Enterovibrio calviensis]|uniref:DUF6942 family protein n=1 Tax=Enterovibrio calviensis TaxID=91359 RepID=UPI0004879934|nr:hypothetical protein [Enterovibrio calviensis]
MHAFSLGSPNASIHVYVEKSPPLDMIWGDMPNAGSNTPLSVGEIKAVGEVGGNGWRKVFNVYAKLLCALPEHSRLKPKGFQTWQVFRDKALLQADSNTRLYFGAQDLKTQIQSSAPHTNGIHIIAGRTHAAQLNISHECVWLDQEFAKHPSLPILICPYFDYRQLSNAKIDVLAGLIVSLESSCTVTP